jgi:nitrite reductase/ring-hydroxylating ferredoxin subunit
MSTRFQLLAADVPAEQVRRVCPPGREPIAVYHIDGEFHATDDRCTHGDASLSEGEIEDGLIVCPHHAGAFCIRTGEARSAPCYEALRAYPIVRDGDALFIELGE